MVIAGAECVCVQNGQQKNEKKAAEKQDSESTCPWWSMKGRRLVGWTDPDLFMRWTLRLSQNSAAVSTLASSAPSRGWRNVRWEIIKYLTKKLPTEGQISNELELEPTLLHHWGSKLSFSISLFVPDGCTRKTDWLVCNHSTLFYSYYLFLFSPTSALMPAWLDSPPLSSF